MSAAPKSPNLMDFGDSPRGLVAAPPDDPFAIVASASASAHGPVVAMDDPFAIVSGSTPEPSPSSFAFMNNVSAAVAGDASATQRVSMSNDDASNDVGGADSLRSSRAAPTQLHFFVSCAGVDGNLIQTTSRSAQNIMRGALSILAQSSSTSKTKSPRGKPPTDVSVEVRVTREFTLMGHEPVVATSKAPPPLLEAESYWSERRKSRAPRFAVGFNVSCHLAEMRDRHVQIMIMIPEENATSNKNAQLFGYAQASFQELYTIATSGAYQQTMMLPVHSTVLDGATVEVRFANVHALVPELFHGYHSVFRSYLFYPPVKEDTSERAQAAIAVAPKLAREEATEVDFSVKIPLQLLKVCQYELRQMHDEWKARYNFNRKKSRHFEDDAEALNFGHDIFRVQVICGRNLTNPSATGGSADGGAQSVRPSTFSSLAGGRNGIMNRLKTQAGKWGGPGSDGGSGGAGASGVGSGGAPGRNGEPTPVSAFVVVKICDGNGATQEHLVGRTNTEYETAAPVWSMNKFAANCPHGKPNTKLFVSPTLPSRVELSPVNQLKQFLFYRPSLAQSGHELGGWLRLEVYNESYGIMSGVDNDLIGEVLIPLQSLRDAMTVEDKIVWEGEEGSASRKAHAVHALTLVDWFDVRTPHTDEVQGQIQLRLHILLANPAVASAADLLGDGSDPVLSPRRQRLAADSYPPSSNPLESEMPLNFLYPHVLTLQRQIAEVTDMIRLCEQLVEQKRTFKSSQHKKRADIQGIPTNLHVSYFRIFRNFGSGSGGASGPTTSGALLPPAPTGTARKLSTEDLLGIESPVPSTGSRDAGSAPVAPLSMTSVFQSLQDRTMFSESHATITVGAPTAHAMGLSEYGLREMELEIHRLQGILDRCNPRMTTTTTTTTPASSGDSTHGFVTEDAAEYAFSSLQDEQDDLDDDAASPQPAEQIPSLHTVPAGATKPKKYSNLAARAVANAKKATAKRRHPAKSKSKGHESDDASGTGGRDEIKYPPLKTDPDEGMDPMTSVQYAVRVLCRLEMLRAEYYLRKSVSVSQSVSSLVTCFLAKLELCLQEKNLGVLDQMAKIGFLIGWESLISSHGKELRMLSDAWVAIKCLETFAFQLHECNDSKDVVLEKRHDVGYTIRVPVPSHLFALLPDALRDGQLISITSVLFTQGINEMQSLANMVGHAGVSIQAKINTTSFRSIVEYYNRFSGAGVPLAESHVGSHPDEILRNLRVTVESENSSSKNTHILFHAADAVRSLNGGRITYCKSGKDRTAMSVTLEQARLLVQRKRHVLQELLEARSGGSPSEGGPLEEVKDVANTMREFGVRIEIAKKNVGRYKYSFNSLQRKLLPEIYRPPMSTIQDMVTSVTARDS